MRRTPYAKLKEIYTGDGRTLEVREQLKRGDEEFGSIRIGVSTLLMRRELDDLFWGALFTVAAALGIAVFVAGVFAQLLLRPIHVLRSGLTRLGKGEFGVTLDLPPGDEFGELGDFFNTVSQQLSADRSLLAGQKANLQTAVEHLEDAVALFNPSGELLFSNPAMQHTLPGRCDGPRAAGAAAQRASVSDARRGDAGDAAIARARAESAASHRTDRRRLEWVGCHAAAESRPHDEELIMTHAIMGTSGELVGVLLVSRNLAHLSRMQSTLAYSRKLVALGRLTAGIAHEVKNPLNAMMIHLELLRTKIRGNAASACSRSRLRRRAECSGLGLGAPTALPHPSRARSSTSPSSRAKSGGWMRSCRGS